MSHLLALLLVLFLPVAWVLLLMASTRLTAPRRPAPPSDPPPHDPHQISAEIDTWPPGRRDEDA